MKKMLIGCSFLLLIGSSVFAFSPLDDLAFHEPTVTTDVMDFPAFIVAEPTTLSFDANIPAFVPAEIKTLVSTPIHLYSGEILLRKLKVNSNFRLPERIQSKEKANFIDSTNLLKKEHFKLTPQQTLREIRPKI